MKRDSLYISWDGLLDPLGESQILSYLRKLSSRYQIEICSLEKSFRSKNEVDCLKKELNELGIIWNYSDFKQAKFGTVRNLISLIRTVKNSMKTTSYKIFHCRSYMAMISGIIGVGILSRKVKLLFDIRGFLFLEKLELMNFVLKTIMLPFFCTVEKILFMKADRVVTLTHRSVPRIAGMTKAPVDVIPTCYNIELVETEESDYSEKEYDFVYLGSAGGTYRLDIALKVFSAYKSCMKNARMLIINASQHRLCMIEVKKLGLGEFVDIVSCKHKEIGEYLKRCRYGVYFIDKKASKPAQCPTRFAELVAHGLPVITGSGIGDTDRIYRKYNPGIILNAKEDNKMIRKAMKRLISLEYSELCKASYKCYCDNFRLIDGVEKYNQIYRTICAE